MSSKEDIGSRIKVAHLRLISTENVWGSVWEREHTFRNLGELGVDVDYFYEGCKATPDMVAGHDILNIGEFSFGSWQEPFIREHKKPVIMFQETSYKSLVAGSKNVDLELIRSKPYFIALTNWSRDLLIHFGINGNKIEVIPCAADLETFKPGRTETGHEKEPVFLYVGSFNKKKGAHHVLRCFSEAGMGSLIMVEGEFNNNDSKLIREMINDLGINDRVIIKRFPGLKDLPIYYHMSDVVIYPQSYEEGEPVQFGHPLLWGLSCGLPLVSLNMGGARELIDDGRNGYLCNSYEEMVSCMKSLAIPQLREQLGLASYNMATSKFHPFNIGRRYKMFYRRVLNEN